MGSYSPLATPGYATVFTPDVMSIHDVSRLLQFFLSGFAFISLLHQYWKCIDHFAIARKSQFFEWASKLLTLSPCDGSSE